MGHGGRNGAPRGSQVGAWRTGWDSRRVPDGGVEDGPGLQEGPRWGRGGQVAHICFPMPNTQKVLYQLRQEAFSKAVLFSEMWKCVH